MIFSRLSERSRVIVAVVLFVVIFAALLIAASFTDLKVSDILTENALTDGEYLSHDVFGVGFEIFGSSPIYIMAGVCVVLLMLYIWRTLKLRPVREVICAVLLAGSVLAYWFFFNDMFGYIAEHAHAEHTYLDDSMTLIAVLCALMTSALSVAAFYRIKDETLRKLMKFVIAFVIMAVIANVLVMIIKDPVGRMRYRAMNSDVGQSIGGFANFQNWYESRGGQPENLSAMFESVYGVTDAFKSFPSGHTCAAGMTYALIMLPDVLGTRNKGLRALCWIFPVVFTGIVAVSRIVVGAHFFSDVLFGGTIAFLSMAFAREAIIFRFRHFRCFGKNYVPELSEAEESAAE